MRPRPYTGRSRYALVARAAALCGAVACSGDNGSTGPSPTAECGSGGVVSLAPLQAVTLDCSSGGTFTLSGRGASYLVVPQLAVGDAPNRPVTYALGVGSGAVATAVRSEGPTAAIAALRVALARTGRPGPGKRQRAFDAALRRRIRGRIAGGVAVPAPSFAVAAPPPAGSLRDFHVLATIDTSRQTFQRVTARLAFVGQNILVYVDTLAPTGFTADQLNGFGQLFDQTFYSLDVGAFGAPSDEDQDGRVIMLLSPVVNELTPASQCAIEGYIAGFFDGFDLVSQDTSSNRGEIFYGVVPDPNGKVSCAHSVDAVLGDVPSVFLHELQHLINFSQHVLVHGGPSEDGWLDEGLSLVASELGALYYEQKFPPPTGRTDPNQLLPDSAEGFIETEFASSYDYLLQPDTVTLTSHSDADLGLTWRGSDWLLVRWLGDQEGTAFFHRLEETALTGTTNIAAAAGESFPGLFGDFSLALYADSIPGIPKTSIPPRDRFVTRTLRQVYQAYFNAAGPSASVPRPFPIAPTVLAGSTTGSLVPGTVAFYQLTTAADAATVQLQFTGPAGVALSATLHPQVAVFRLPGP